MKTVSEQLKSACATRTLTTAAFILVALEAAAQTAPNRSASTSASEETIKLEAFGVTGSAIKRIEQEKALPMSILDRDIMETRDAQTPVDLLTSLPQVTSTPLNEAGTTGAAARGDDASISVRGLSTGNALILLNGRRLAPHPISDSEGGVPALSVNVNQLPNRGVDHIEVLRDGASAIYGSDAVAGVVNYIMRRDYRGGEILARYGDTTDGGGREWRGTLLFGKDFAGGKGHFATTFDVFHRDVLFTRDRKFSSDADNSPRAPAPWNDVNVSTQFFQRSTGSAYGNFTVGTVSATGVFTGTRPAGVPAALASTAGALFFVPDGAGGATFSNAGATPLRTGVQRDYYFNLGDYRVIQPETTRYNWYGTTSYDVSKSIALFGDLSYYRAKSTTYREPDQFAASTDAQIVVAANNPWNPFGSRFFDPAGAPNSDGTPRLQGTPSPVRLQNKRFSDLPSRTARVDSRVYRAVVGVRGKLLDTWNWESAVLYSAAETEDNEANSTRESLLKAAINGTNPATTYNPFGYNFAVRNGTVAITSPYKNSADVIRTFQQDYIRTGKTSVGSIDFRAGGTLLPLWGGNVLSAAIGGEFRHETYDDTRPPFAGLNPPGSGLSPTDNDFIALSPNADTHAKRDVTAGYLEIVAPLVGRQTKLPLVESFEVSASGRMERYSDFGSSRKPKLSANWRLFSALMVRASYNEGFRAPNLAQLFTGELTRSNTSTDNYRSPVTALPADGSANRLVKSGGNAGLHTEDARGKSVGVVLEVPWIKGLSASVDYWEVNQLGIVVTNTPLPDDFDALTKATQAALAAGQAINSVDLGSGTDNYKGSPFVVRLPVTQQDRDFFNAYNAIRPRADQRAPVGQISFYRQSYFNAARVFSNGFDYNLTYRLPELPLGRFTVTTDWMRLNSFFQYGRPTDPRDDRLWQDGAPKWRGNVAASWRKGGWGAGAAAYYIGNYTDTNANTTATIYNNLGRPSYIAETFDQGLVRYRNTVASTTTYNAHLAYSHRGTRESWLRDTSVRVGVINLLNKEPPLFNLTRGYDTTIYNSLARGRSVTLQLGKKF